VVAAGVEETTRLLENKFDYIFFTGEAPVPSLRFQAGRRARGCPGLAWICGESLTTPGSRRSPYPQAAPPWGGW